MRLIRVGALLTVVSFCGCAPDPTMVRIDVRGPKVASVWLGSGPDSGRPPDCNTPCDAVLEPFTHRMVSIVAEQFYPARFDLEWSVAGQAIGAGFPEPVPLVVPLQPRPRNTPIPAE